MKAHLLIAMFLVSTLLGGCASMWQPKGVHEDDYWRPQAGTPSLGIVICGVAVVGSKDSTPEYLTAVEKQLELDSKEIDPATGKLVLLKPDNDPALTEVCRIILKAQGVGATAAGGEAVALNARGFRTDLLPLFEKYEIDMLLAGLGRYASNLDLESGKAANLANSGNGGGGGNTVNNVATLGVAGGVIAGVLPAGTMLATGGGISKDPYERWLPDFVMSRWTLTGHRGKILAAYNIIKKTKDPVDVQALLLENAKEGYAEAFRILKESEKPLAVPVTAPSPGAS